MGESQMANKQCPVCGKELGFLTPKVILKDGAICSECAKEAGYSYASKNLTEANKLYVADFIKNTPLILKDGESAHDRLADIIIDDPNI